MFRLKHHFLSLKLLDEIGMSEAMYTLVIISLVILSTDEVKVQPLRTEIHGLSRELCCQQQREIRAKGPQWQARCVEEKP